ncbi:MAG: MATE family efflux transporter [bacterium]
MPKPRASRLNEFLAEPRRAVWVLAAPMMASMAVHTIYMVVDTAFIGSLGKEALAAVTFVGPLFFVLIALINGLATAITALVAQAFGRKDHAEADRVASSAVGVALLLGIVIGGIGLLLGPWLLRVLGAKGQTHAYAWDYFQVITVTVPLFFTSAVLRSVLTGEGDAKTPMVIFAASTVINLGFDALFIFGFGWGVWGAALATAVAQTFSLATFAYVLFVRRRSLVKFRASQLGIHRPLLRGLFTIGLPTAAGQFIMAVGMAAFNRVLAHFGESAVAGYGAASRVDMFVAMPIFGLASAAVAVLGMFAGAGRPDLIRSTSLYVYRWVLTLAVVVGAAAYLSSGYVIRIFIQEAEAVSIGSTYLGYMLLIYPMMAFGATSGRILQGLGYGVPSLIITLVRVLLVGVPVAYVGVFAYGAPIEWVWTAMIIGGVCSTILSFFWVRLLMWRRDPTERAARAGEAAPAEPAPELPTTLPAPDDASR